MDLIGVLIVDDHAVLRAAVRMLIEEQSDMRVVGEAGSLPAAIEAARLASPDVISLDLCMPGESGTAGINRLRAAAPSASILVLTMHDDPAYVRSALASGASGFVVKSAADSDLISAIRAVSTGRVFVNMRRSGTSNPMDQKFATFAADTPIASLSAREREVLLDVARGHTSQEIADRIGRSVKTVESYRARMMRKLGLKSRVELTAMAMEAGLLEDHVEFSEGATAVPLVTLPDRTNTQTDRCGGSPGTIL